MTNTFIPVENENVLLQAKVGKKIFHVYLLIQILCTFLGTILLATGIMAWLKDIDKAWLIIVFCAVFYLLIFVLIGHYFSTKNRIYVLTDKRIVIIRGGKMKRVNRSLSLKSIQGVEKSNNFLYNLYGLATIDFYALAVANNTTKIKFFSFSSTNFKFQWVDRTDADAVYAYIQSYLVSGTFPSEEEVKHAPQNDDLGLKKNEKPQE